MSEKKKIEKLDLDNLESVAGGVNIGGRKYKVHRFGNELNEKDSSFTLNINNKNKSNKN